VPNRAPALYRVACAGRAGGAARARPRAVPYRPDVPNQVWLDLKNRFVTAQ